MKSLKARRRPHLIHTTMALAVFAAYGGAHTQQVLSAER